MSNVEGTLVRRVPCRQLPQQECRAGGSLRTNTRTQVGAWLMILTFRANGQKDARTVRRFSIGRLLVFNRWFRIYGIGFSRNPKP